MCGIVGIAGKLEFRDEKLMKSLLVNDYIRGPDSTGFASISKQDEIKLSKIPSHPFDLFDMGSFKSALSAHNSKMFLGHNRAATRGKVCHGNAHPFEIDGIVGVHNGSLDYQEWRDLEDAAGEKFGTDSAAIIACIARIGVKDTLKLMRGAWSLVWMDVKDNSINFLRNVERPMFLAWSKNFDRLYFSSSWQIMSASILLTENYNATDDLDHGTGKNSFTYMPTEVDTHYRINLQALAEGGKKLKPTIKKIAGKPKGEVVTMGGYHPFKQADGDTDQKSLPGLPGPVTKPDSGMTSPKITSGRDTVHDRVVNLFTEQPFAQWISKDKFDELSRHGCSWCGQNDFNWEDAGWIVIERDDAIICPHCTKEREGNRIYTKVEPYLV